jgi:signal transduction histidine kinase/CheY-like chemotaxis protein
MEYFLDDTGQLDFAAARHDPRYRPYSRDNLTLGFSRAVLWVRFSLHNPGMAEKRLHLQVEPERLERLALFLPGESGNYRRLDNGLRIPIDQRPLSLRTLAFPLSIEAGQTLTLYLRAETRNPLSLMPVLWSPPALATALMQEDWVAILSFGAGVGLAGYALLLFPLQRNRAAVFLGLSLILGGIAELSNGGYGSAYLWPGHTDWAVRATLVFFLLATAAFNRLIKDFLNLKHWTRRHAMYWQDGLFWVILALAATSLYGSAFTMLGNLGILAIITAKLSNLGFSLLSLMRGYRPVGYLILGQLIIGMATMIRIGESLGWLPFTPISSQTWAAVLSYTAGLSFFAAVSRRLDLLQQEKEIAEQADRAKSEFMARVSHELRSPLHTILGYAALLRHDCGKGKMGERLNLLEEGGRHLLRLIEDLLDYARCERNHLVLTPEPVFLHRLLMRLDDHGAALASRHANQYRRQNSGTLPVVVMVDPHRLEQAVLVLLSNAATYTHGGTLILHIRAEPLMPARTRLHVEVRDNGIGIASTDLARIFQPFERAGPGREGLGLGLAIARQIVRAMGGEISVSSQPGTGSRFGFSIELPLSNEAEIPFELEPPDILGYSGPTRRLLLLDDTQAHRHLLEHLLSDLGFEIRSAATLEEARRWLQTETFDLALLDQWLPDGNVSELLPEWPPNLPAILISAMPPVPQSDPKMPFRAVLLKPVTSETLLDTISRILDLTWIHPGQIPASASSAHQLNELQALAEIGAVYEIEAWIEHNRQTRSYPEDWLHSLETRLVQMDFRNIAALAAARMEKEL